MTNTLFVGKVYHQFEELPSTNDWALEMMAKSKPPEGIVVRADTQTAGRGQFGSKWISPPGENLLFSVIFYPNWLAVQDQFYLSMAVALALHEAIALPETAVKWPNDLYFDDKKLGGILIQNSINGSTLQSSVVGIGLNVNQMAFDPALPNPASLALATGATWDLDSLLGRICSCLEKRYLALRSGRLAATKQDYEAVLYRKGLATKFIKTSDDTAFIGTITGVTETGLLQVENQNLEPEVFDLKAIRII